MYPTLNFDFTPSFKIKTMVQKTYIFDRVRKKYIILTPEEWVRQYFLAFLMDKKNISASLISVERGQKYNLLQKRFDIKVFDNKADLKAIIECKSPKIKLTPETLFQALTYAKTSSPAFIILTNGIQHIYYDYASKLYLENFPNLGSD